jgi:hypothetical protein
MIVLWPSTKEADEMCGNITNLSQLWKLESNCHSYYERLQFATRIRVKLVASNHFTNLFSLNCKDWFLKNLSNKKNDLQKEGWKTIFMVACWHLWTWQNKVIFDEDFRHHANPIHVILKTVKVIDKCEHYNFTTGQRQMNTIFIGWKHPQ